jgi:hypothetical protein
MVQAQFVQRHETPSPPLIKVISLLRSTGAQITGLVGSGGLPGVARQTHFSLKLQF